MRPLRLQVKNFLSYGENVPPLTFDGLHVVCLSGPNGHGKSAILDAITWALWGKARAQRDDDLIHHGRTEMLVDLEFLLEGQRYRVRRERLRRSKRGRTVLDFFVWDPERQTWRTLTEANVRATQEHILHVLKLDYETFITSAYLKQGQADLFTTMRPAERKAVLAEILRLDQYARWEKRAKERVQDLDLRIATTSGEIERIQEDLAREDAYRRELAEAQEALERLQQALAEAQERENMLNTQRQLLLQAREEYAHLQRRLAEWRKEVETLIAKEAQLEAERRRLEEARQKRDEIEARYREWQRLQEEAKRWDRLLQRSVVLEAELRKVRDALHEARLREERILAQLEAQAREWRRQAAGEDQARQRLVQAEQALQALAALEQERQEADARLQALREERATLRQALKTLKEEMEALKERIERLEGARGEPACPLCGQALTEAHVQEMLQALAAEGKEKGNAYRRGLERLREVDAETQELEQRVRALEKRLREREKWQRQHAQAENALRQAEAARAHLAQLEAEIRAQQERLQTGAYAADLLARKAALEEELQRLGYDPDAHDAVRRQLEARADAVEAYQKLQRADQDLSRVEQDLAEIRAQRQRWEKRIEEETAILREKEAQMATLPEVEQQWRRQVAQVEALNRQVTEAQTRLGAAQQNLAALERQKERLHTLTRRLQTLHQEQTIYRELAEAFGKRGLQAMIIEAVLPELEAEANRLLARMTEGRMSVHLRTQREKVSGGVVETLDIDIADELGIRPYELYSGGEAFRINFALRVALSKLLARRAGASLRSLFIDEGFGSQDTEGRMRLVEAINAIQDEFDLIVVITHIDELKDMFPVRIEVFKGPQGSTYTLTT